MKEALKILAYLAAVLLLGALLAPPLWWLGQWVLTLQPNIQLLREADFQRFFNRSMLIAAIALLWPAMRWLQVRSISDLGLEKNRRGAKHLLIGFFTAWLPLLLFGLALCHQDIWRLKKNLPWDALPAILLTCCTVPILEEALFRGGIIGLVRRSAPPGVALFFVSALFAILHFLKPREEVVGNVTWVSGFTLIPHAFWQFSEPMLLFAGFTTLFIVGWTLGYSRLATRSLWMPIGLHAGWIFGLKTFSKFTKRIDRETLPWLGDTLLVGLGPVAILLLTLLLLHFILARERASAGS